MTRQEAFDCTGEKVYYGEYLKGMLINCYPTTIVAVGKSTAVLQGVRGAIHFEHIFKSEKDFLETCLKLTKQ